MTTDQIIYTLVAVAVICMVAFGFFGTKFFGGRVR